MTFDSKIVPFERSAAFLHHRAMKNRREANLVDALELLRRAVEQSPENREYKLDLAEILCEMGCHEQSNKLLLGILAETNPPSECFYGIALNMLGMNNENGARNAINQYLKNDPKGLHSNEERRLSSELEIFRQLSLPRGRKRARALKLADKACDRMRDEDFDGACRLFEKSFAMMPQQQEMRALYAMNLLLMDDREQSLEQCRQIAADAHASVRALCVVAQVYQMADEPEPCEALVARSLKGDPDNIELRMLLYTMSELNMHDKVAELAKKALFEMPHDRALLHARAVSMYKCGGDAQKASSFWTRIVRIDPEDTIAAYYEDVAMRGELDQIDLGYLYQVPQAEYERRLRYISMKLLGGAEAIEAEWKQNSNLSNLVKWCATVDNPNLMRTTMTVLAAMDNEDALSTLRELFTRESVPTELKLQISMLLHMRGADMKHYLPANRSVREGIMTDDEELLSRLPVGQRQLVRLASDYLEEHYAVQALPVLTITWQTYRRCRSLRTEAVQRTEAAAAALVAGYLAEIGQTPDLTELSRKFGCSLRQLKYFLHRMASVLDSKGVNKDETD